MTPQHRNSLSLAILVAVLLMLGGRGVVVPPGPGPPTPPDGKATGVVVVFAEGPITPRQSEVIQQLRLHFDADDAVDFFAFEQNDKDENGKKISTPYIEAASGLRLPFVLVYGGDRVLWKGELPATSQEVIERAN